MKKLEEILEVLFLCRPEIIGFSLLALLVPLVIFTANIILASSLGLVTFSTLMTFLSLALLVKLT